MVECFAQQKKC